MTALAAMGAVGNLVLIGVAVAAVHVLAWRVRRYYRDVDGYHEREHTDPPIVDISHTNGGW